MTSAVSEIFTDGGTRKRSEILHGCRIGCCRADNDRIVHRAFFLQRVDKRGDGRTLLSDCYIDAVDWVTGFVVATLVDDRVDGNGGLSGLAVSDDQFALSASDRDHCIDSLDTGL